MALTVYFKVVGARLPYGAKGKRRHQGTKRTTVDFGKLGVWRVPNDRLSLTKPDPAFGKAASGALQVLRDIGLA